MPPRFHSLPPEIQDMILEDISREPSTAPYAPYATVCKSWQNFFERKNFRSFAIEQDDLRCLSRFLTARRQGFVKHIWYRIYLPNSNPRISTKIKRFEKPKVTFRADRVFTHSIFGLWDILSLWDPENRITLELSVYAYDDWAPILRQERIFERDLAAYKVHKESGSREPYRYDNPHGPYIEQYRLWGLPYADHRIRGHWNACRHDLIGWKDIELTTARRADARPYYIEENAILPRVPIISKFLIRNTQFRRIYPGTLLQMFKSFKNLEDVTIERWASVDASDETDWARHASVAFASELPASVKTLSINGRKCAVFQDWLSRDVKLRNILAKRFRQYSKELAHMSVTDVIDAKDFLDLFRASVSEDDLESLIRWPDLETLTLSTDLFETQNRVKIEKLLCSAARAARKMPQLRKLEIRSSRHAQCLFRYNVVEAIAEVTWSGPVVDSTDIMKEWEKTSAWRNNIDVINDF
ncbi:hypothetical protein FOYG_05513 [Fusarium oxysporum NRRL 32931]|uniref:DUF6546 domain-containing protein n=1 Tax=Fusarium oxysporum NRRL 32931 TaxID=660029 RepID=W9IQT7_FUSOX|nr:hypothetical protein FOYG_05513 [Fusarium oxysporum NRRL 32931]